MEVYPVGHAAFAKGGQAHSIAVGEVNLPLFIPEIIDTVLDQSSLRYWWICSDLERIGATAGGPSADRFPGDITVALHRAPRKRTFNSPIFGTCA
jgi:hypothetical protein